MITLATVVNSGAEVKVPLAPTQSSFQNQISEIKVATPANEIAEVSVVPGIVQKNNVTSQVELAVKNYFSDIPIMIEIARCESRYRHYDKTGEVLHGVVNGGDRGVMQINEGYHLKTATKLGLDILTLEGNLAYARFLYETQGTRPWSSSSPCWGPSAKGQVAEVHITAS